MWFLFKQDANKIWKWIYSHCVKLMVWCFMAFDVILLFDIGP